jgi:hypothetical protein
MKSIGVLFISSTVVLATSAYAADQTLVSTATTSPILLDGIADKAWEAAKPLVITLDELPYEPSNGYHGMTSTDVTIKSLHDAQNVYFLISYQDPTKSLERFPWVKQADGSWKKLANKDDTGHDNTYYEDKFALFWDINTKFRSRKALLMTETELRLIAAPAMIGLSSKPKNGYSTPPPPECPARCRERRRTGSAGCCAWWRD